MDEQICGVTRVINGKEWVCVNPPHNQQYKRKSTDAKHQGYVDGTGARDGVTPADIHYFQRRYPNSDH